MIKCIMKSKPKTQSSAVESTGVLLHDMYWEPYSFDPTHHSVPAVQHIVGRTTTYEFFDSWHFPVGRLFPNYNDAALSLRGIRIRYK